MLGGLRESHVPSSPEWGLVILPKALSRPCCRCQQRCEKFYAGDPWILYEVFLLAGTELATRRTCFCLWISWGTLAPTLGLWGSNGGSTAGMLSL